MESQFRLWNDSKNGLRLAWRRGRLGAFAILSPEWLLILPPICPMMALRLQANGVWCLLNGWSG